jgi:hypothetical protein
VLGTIVGFYFGSAPDTTHRLTITTTILQDGTAKQAYGPVTLRASGATPPLKWSSNPPLPDGLSLSTDGTLSGTPTAALATKHFTLIVTDSAVPPATAAEDVTLTIK